MVLGRDDYRKKTVRRYLEIELPSGGVARLQSLTEKERAEFETATLKVNGGKRKDGGIQIDKNALMTARCRMIALCLVDAESVRIFADTEIDLIMQMNAADTRALGDACDTLNGGNEEDYKELLKNSEKIHVVDSQ